MAKTLEDYRQESLAKMKRQKSMDAAGKRLAERKSTGVSGKVDRSTPLDRMKARNKGKTVEGSLASLKAKPAAPAPAPTSALDRMKARNKGKTVEGALSTLKGDPTKARIAALGKGLPSKSTPSKAPAKPAPAPAKSSGPVKTVSTKGGDYPVYKKSSAEGKSFAAAFDAARAKEKQEGKASGSSVFTWQGRSYSTKKKGE